MATSIPGNGLKRSTRNGSSHSMTLTYEGKAPQSEILKTPSEDVFRIVGKSSPNKLYWGENLQVLLSMRNDPIVQGKVKLVYIDPPYATGGRFLSRSLKEAYTDFEEGATYLEFLRQRLIILRDLMSDDGSIYLHLDGNMIFHAKIIMDESFRPG